MELLLSLKKPVPEDLWKKLKLSVQVESRSPIKQRLDALFIEIPVVNCFFFLHIAITQLFPK